MNDSDAAIIELYFARDERAIAETDATYGRYCMSISMGILESISDAEECVSDTYLTAWQTIPPKRPTSLKLYLGRIVRNLSISRYRRERRHKRDRTPEVSLSELEACIPMQEDQSSELRDLLEHFLRGLGDLDRRLFVGRYWYGYAPQTLADAYGMTANAVNLRLMRVRENLRHFLTQEGYSI